MGWKAKHAEGPFVSIESGPDRRFRIQQAFGSSNISETYGQITQKEDANLLAAAPDLAKALIGLLEDCQWAKLGTPFAAGMREGRAALLKAGYTEEPDNG